MPFRLSDERTNTPVPTATPLTTRDARDSRARIDARVWHAVLMDALEQSGEGLVICDASLKVLFATQRGDTLLAAFGAHGELDLPAALSEVVQRQLREGGQYPERVIPTSEGAAIYVRSTRIRGAAREQIAVRLRGEVLREDRVSARLAEKFALSPRSLQLVPLLRKGLTNRQIGKHLGLAESTVKTYVYELYQDCGVSNRASLLALIDDIAMC
jgi:DNA-binding NarL/FixJ family response regulator